MGSKILTASTCHECRSRVIDAFRALAGVSTRSRLPTSRIVPSLASPVPKFRGIHSSKHLLDEQPSQVIPADLNSTPTAQNQLPWYLRVPPPASPSSITRSTSTAPEIPSLPANPPPILSPLLQYIYTTLGLDSLTILDLRHHVYPPPALGPNLIMLIATARSVKHLNVSADRLCRWFRTNYKLRPFADGLLGRNELKIRLRRKARRQKLTASVGNTVDVNSRSLGADYGITTGWICVNIGQVAEFVDGHNNQESHQLTNSTCESEASDNLETPANLQPPKSKAQERPEEDEEEYINPAPDYAYAGFGSSSTAPRIVVQMFTEEKRAEVDLEGLWSARQERKARQDRDFEESQTIPPSAFRSASPGFKEAFVDVSSRNEGSQRLTCQHTLAPDVT